MPDYGIKGPDEGSGLLPWTWAQERLTASRNYWLTSLWPDGRPHSMPVWGVWDEEALWFSSGRRSRKARNLEADARCVVTTEDANSPVIVEGSAELIERAGADRARRRSDERQVRRRHHRRVPRRACDDPGPAAVGVRARPRRLQRIAHALGVRLARGELGARAGGAT